MSFACSDFTYKWDHVVFVYSFSIRSIHIVSDGQMSYFFMAEQHSIVCVCIIFSFITEQLGCFHILLSVNNAAEEKGMCIVPR